MIEGEVVRVDASMTSDAENDALVFRWRQLGGLPIEIDENNTPLLSFVAPQVSQDQTLSFQLEVFDGRDTSSTNISVVIRNNNRSPDVIIANHAANVGENE